MNQIRHESGRAEGSREAAQTTGNASNRGRTSVPSSLSSSSLQPKPPHPPPLLVLTTSHLDGFILRAIHRAPNISTPPSPQTQTQAATRDNRSEPTRRRSDMFTNTTGLTHRPACGTFGLHPPLRRCHSHWYASHHPPHAIFHVSADLKPGNVLICIDGTESITQADLALSTNDQPPPTKLAGVPPPKGAAATKFPGPGPSALGKWAFSMSKLDKGGKEDTSKHASSGSGSSLKRATSFDLGADAGNVSLTSRKYRLPPQAKRRTLGHQAWQSGLRIQGGVAHY
ncbi:hypothetical protein AX16_010054 [Volvariella volvacea WC 439]|nr:hypothetical protein AX16_010054 [Volvariella volvacea WC 439]